MTVGLRIGTLVVAGQRYQLRLEHHVFVLEVVDSHLQSLNLCYARQGGEAVVI